MFDPMLACPNLVAAAQHMSYSGAGRVPLATIAAAFGRVPQDRLMAAEADMAKFAEEHAFAHQWAGEGRDDEGNEPPIAADTSALLDALYEGEL